MSDQGDAGQWRPASRQNDHSAPDDTTGPIPVVPGDDVAEQGFPSPGGAPDPWSEDDESTGGFASASVEPPSFSTRAPFEPADPSPADPSPADSSPADPSSVDPSPAAYESEPSDDVWSTGGAVEPAAETHETRPFEAVEEKPAEPAYEAPDDTPAYEFPEAKPYVPEASSFSYGYGGAEEEPAPGPRGLDALSAEPPRTYGSMRDTAPPETPEDQDEEFFAQDDHPPMWDKVVAPAPAGPPPKPGKPSSGNLRLPDWMRDEAAGGGRPGRPPGGSDGFDEGGGSKKGLYAGLALLVAGLVAVGGVYVMKGGGTADASHTSSPGTPTKTTSSPPVQPPKAPQKDKQLGHFRGVPTATAGRISDPKAGLSYPRFGSPWSLSPKASPMSELGFNVSQFAITEQAGGKPKRWARLMSAQLGGAEKSAYTGPGSERAAATQAASSYEARMYGFRHKKKLLASQPLVIGGHKGWLVGYYLTYNRPGSKSTGDVVTVALVDTGKAEPGVLFMSVPNTNRKLWPDVNYVVRQLKVM